MQHRILPFCTAGMICLLTTGPLPVWAEESPAQDVISADSSEPSATPSDSVSIQEQLRSSGLDVFLEESTADAQTIAQSKQITQKMNELQQPDPDYTITVKNGKATTADISAMVMADLAQNGPASSMKTEKETEKEQELKAIPKTSASYLDQLKASIFQTKKTVDEEAIQKRSESLTALGIVSESVYDPVTKQDVNQPVYCYLYGTTLATVSHYFAEKTSLQDVQIDYRSLSAIHAQTLQAAAASDSDEVLQKAVDTTMSTRDVADMGSSTVRVLSKDITPPTIEKKTDEVKVEVGSDVTPETLKEEIVDQAVDAQGDAAQVEVDASQVDPSTPGVYPVDVTAVDAMGNCATEQASVEVLDDFYQRIANAALAQVGVTQDCTMLVTNSLAAVGIYHHGWPVSYMNLGTVTQNPVPGDIIVYQGHVAIYIGNGMAVHGGWNGWTTAIYSVNCTTPFIAYIHPYHV